MVDQSSVVTDEAPLVRAPHPEAAASAWHATPRTGRIENERSQSDTAAMLLRRWALRVRPRPAGALGTALSPELRSALVLFEAAAQGSANGRVSAPSAGALYPYEHVVICDEDGKARCYLVDPAARTVRQVAADARLRQVVVRARYAGLPDCRCVVATVVRPWMSMRKYGDRGWMYAQLDAAHASTQLLVAAAGTHAGAVPLGPDDLRALDAACGLESRCRAPHSAVALGEPLVGRSCAPDGWNCYPTGDSPPFHVLESVERLAWASLTAGPARGGRPVADGLRSGAQCDLAVGTRLRPEVLREFAAAAGRRRSAKDFRAATLPAAPLSRALAAACGTGSRTRVTLIARRVAGLAQGAYDVDGGRLGAPGRNAVLPDAEELVDICMGQSHLRDACAALVLHQDRREVLGHGRGGVEQALADAGAIGHLLYLAATAEGIAITAIGGFDAARWHAAAGLDESSEVLYVLMLGVAGDCQVKVDRDAISKSHGEV